MFSAERDWNLFNSWSAAGHKMGRYLMYGEKKIENLEISWEISKNASVLKGGTEQMMKYWINLDLWETAHLPLP